MGDTRMGIGKEQYKIRELGKEIIKMVRQMTMKD